MRARSFPQRTEYRIGAAGSASVGDRDAARFGEESQRLRTTLPTDAGVGREGGAEALRFFTEPRSITIAHGG